ncbi:NAD-dependent epimerase/dehydratase family protein [Burkholderia ambifaria]|uniref:NAD-dependent epimerase/dehydratase family protein n=1 Tax=Burkholderia ambifaria TaxID=152480 RepID=UPI001B930F22|nr:NAD(P)-dependent oxidoreductase [Burkholderia ambifaria]MBR8257581.1 NAD(P)-dependent oxidoreductase [Burkholderia ambifaria]
MNIYERSFLMAQFERVAVTGAAGLLGRYLVDALDAPGRRLTAFDRREPDQRALDAHPDVEWQTGDMLDRAALDRLVADKDAIVHAAAVPNIWSGNGETIMKVNVLGTWQLFDAAEAAGVKRVVLCSSDSVVGYTVHEGRLVPPQYAPVDDVHPLQATDPYALSKILCEDIARAAAYRGMEVVVLRPVFIAYPEMEGEIRARAASPSTYRGGMAGGPSTAGGGPLHHHVDPRDVGAAFAAALSFDFDTAKPRYERFFLTAQTTLSPEPTLARLERLLGQPIPVRNPEQFERNPFAPLYDLAPLRERLGFVPQYDQRHLLDLDK